MTLSWVAAHLLGDVQFGTLLSESGSRSSYEVFKLMEAREMMAQELQSKVHVQSPYG
jgi:hypothetical protein